MKVFELAPTFQKTTLNNGVRILTEHHPNTRTVSAGVYVNSGTRDEPSQMVGASHFVEHLVFKGTAERSALELAQSLEAVGGELNAFTTREFTCFHATSLREHLPLCLDVLTDLVRNAQFLPEDMEKERQVILHEIDMAADELEEYIFDCFFENAYGNHPLARPILGTPETLKQISRDQLIEYYKGRYKGDNVVLSVAGAVDHDQVVEQVQGILGSSTKLSVGGQRQTPSLHSFYKTMARPSEQVHILLGYPASSFCSQYRFEGYIINALLGDGMTSRLYQKIREKEGLAYTVYSYLHSLTDSGLLMIYAATAPESAARVTEMIWNEVSRIKKNGIDQNALKYFRRQVEGTIMVAADDIENRMNSLAVNELVFGQYKSVEEVVGEIRQVNVDTVQEYLETYLDEDQMGVLLQGRVEDSG